ncbi:hypothetical protein GF385_01880 [Candidatus Dependentiae bacterium]|nr:hypothetical protein [Candidatus Dependentiae bacterium]
MKKSFLLGILLSIFFTTLNPISENGAKWVGVGCGVGAGALTLAGILYDSGSFRSEYGGRFTNRRRNNDVLFATVFGLGVGGLVGYLAYKIAMYNTPKAKFNRASDIINKILLEDLVAKKFNSVELYIRYILGRFSSNWPLVDARQKLQSIKLNLIEARTLLTSACSQAVKDHKYLYDGAKEFYEIIDDFLDRIFDRMSVLISHPFYKDQLKRYEKYQKELRKRQEKMHQRWEKQREKQKDRELLQNLAGQRPANVGINFNMG